MKKLMLIAVITAMLAGLAPGRDLNPPPWDYSSLPNQTYQAWEFTFEPGPEPSFVNNPFGNPTLMDYTGTWPSTVEGPDGTIIDTLHIDEPGGLTIWIPNNPDENMMKLIYWQMTSDKSPTPTGAGPSTTTPGGSTGTNLPSPYPQIQHQGTWYTYNGLIQIIPNPQGEWIHFDLVPSTNIEEIVIYTVCIIPEPATVGLLLVGGLVLMRRRPK